MKNLKALLVNVGLIVLGALMLVFMSQAYETAKATVAGVTMSDSVPGYDAISFEKGQSDAANLLAVANILVIVFVSLLIIVAVLNLLTSCGVIKNEKLANILHIASVALAVLAAVSAVLGLIGAAISASDLEKLLGGAMTVKTGWACILNLVLGVLTAGVATYDFLTSRKAK